MSGHNLDRAEDYEITHHTGDDIEYLIEQCIQKHMNKERTVNHLLENFQIVPEVTTKIWESLEVANPEFFKWFDTQCDVIDELNEKLDEINQSGLIDMMREYATLIDGPSNTEIRSFLLETSADLTASTSSVPETVPRVAEVPKEDHSKLSSRAKSSKEKQLRNQVQLLLQAQEQLASSASSVAPAPESTASSSSRPAIGPSSVSAVRLDSSELAPMAKTAKQMRNERRKAKKKEKKLLNQVAEQQQQQTTLDSSPSTETAPEVQRLSSSTVSQKDKEILEEISKMTRQLESIMIPVLKLLESGAGPSSQKPSGSRAKTVPKQPSRDQGNDDQQKSGVTGDNQQQSGVCGDKQQTEKTQEHDLQEK